MRAAGWVCVCVYVVEWVCGGVGKRERRRVGMRGFLRLLEILYNRSMNAFDLTDILIALVGFWNMIDMCFFVLFFVLLLHFLFQYMQVVLW